MTKNAIIMLNVTRVFVIVKNVFLMVKKHLIIIKFVDLANIVVPLNVLAMLKKVVIVIQTDETNENTIDGKTTNTFDGKEVWANLLEYKDLEVDVVERYNKIKFDKVFEKEYCDYENFYCDKK